MADSPRLEARTSQAKSVDTEVVPVFLAAGQKHGQKHGKKAGASGGKYASLIERMRKTQAFVGRHGQTQYVRFGGKGGADSSLFLGMGAPDELTEEKLRLSGGHAWQRLRAEKSKAASIDADSLIGAKTQQGGLAPERMVRAFAEGMVMGAYRFHKHKSKADDDYAGPSRLAFVTRDKKLQGALSRELEEIEAVAESVRVTRDWSNEPSNIGTPEFFAGEAKRLAAEHGLKCTILTEKDAAREKMGLFLGVGQGAEREGRIVVLDYNPKGAKKTLALVGKGITFDSGGISIKPSMRMEEMKHDMTGAATVMGAILLASRWKVPNRVIAFMAFTENMPDGNAIQPGNVLTSRAGKTVEVINTDAEGRLILADVLDYAQDFKPDFVVDAATLTGAVSIALGKLCCGLLGNDEELMGAIRAAAGATGERVWELPLYDEYFEDLKSDTADMRNSANDSYGGTIRGGIFLKQFIRKGTRWAHLDIAATAWNVGHLSYIPKRGASGVYVRTLARLAADL